MKQVLAVLLLLASCSAFAQTTIPVCNVPSPISVEPESVTAQLTGDSDSPDLKRAWVEIAVEGPQLADNGGNERNYIKQKIDGLSLEPATKNIVYQASKGSDVVICATFKKGGMLSRNSFAPTGKCKFMTKVKAGSVDNGFHAKKTNFIVVDMIVG